MTTSQTLGNLFPPPVPPPPSVKAGITRRKNVKHRNKLLVEEFNEMYNKQRLRFDDVMEKLAHRFGLTKATIEKILKNYEK
jgi:hypothetical protein